MRLPRLPVVLAAIAALILVSVAISRNDPTPSGQGGAQATPEERQVPADPRGVTVTAEEIGPNWKVQQEGAFLTLQYSRAFEPVEPGGGASRLTVNVSSHGSFVEAADAFDRQYGSLAKAEAIMRASFVYRPIDAGSITFSEVTDHMAKLGAEQERVYCATFTQGSRRYAELLGAFRIANGVVRYTAFGAAPQGCRGDTPIIPDANALAQAQFAKLQTQSRSQR